MEGNDEHIAITCRKPEPKRHHYVPQSYLQNFAAIGGVGPNRICVYDKSTGAAQIRPIKNTAVIGQYYTFKDATGQPNTELERFFASVESRAAAIIRRWLEPGAVPSVSDIGDMAAYLACLYVRVPRCVEAARDMIAATCVGMTEHLAEDPDRLQKAYDYVKAGGKLPDDFSIEDLRQLTKEFDSRFIVHVDEKYAIATSLSVVTAVCKQFMGMYWALCDSAPFSGQFITCDAPVNVFTYHDGMAMFYGGLSGKDVEIHFPLSPTICVALSRTDRSKRRRATPAFVREINKRTVLQAENYIFACTERQSVKKLIERYGGVVTRGIDADTIKSRVIHRLRRSAQRRA